MVNSIRVYSKKDIEEIIDKKIAQKFRIMEYNMKLIMDRVNDVDAIITKFKRFE